VAAIVLQAVWRIGGRTLKNPRKVPALWAIALASFVAIAVLKVPFPWVVLAAGLAGVAGGKWLPTQFAPAASHAARAVGGHGALRFVIDDDTPTPAHARFSRGRLAAIVAAGALLWLLPMAGLVAASGADSALTQMGWFFTKAALLTFGGAYAVLPYVYQGAVEQHQWLTAAQMMDGLALGETTPGPLIMVVAFVAFVGGWTHRVLGPDMLFLGAAVAAIVVTWFTFLPSFLFILAGGPVVEATHGNLKFTAPLTGVTAAVVGVIATLALFFIEHIARPAGDAVDWVALVIAAAATVALLRFKVGVIPVIAGCAVAGLLIRFVSGF
jgi:chromate transporter